MGAVLPLDAKQVFRLRADFPALALRVHERPLIYLDNASTTQKPRPVLEALSRAYIEECANIHRGVHLLSQIATERYEATREKVRRFLSAPSEKEVIFTRGTTEAINLIAKTLGPLRVGAGDEVLVSRLEHHSNLVPWQMLCAERQARLLPIPLDASGKLRLDAFADSLHERTRIVAVSHASNALGNIVPIAELSRLIHKRAPQAIFVVDGAQAVPHLRVDVEALGCDFYCFSGHKLYGPTGVGVLWGRSALLKEMPPWQGGGDMILSVSFEKSIYQDPPHKFEAGTPPIAEVIALGAALDYLAAQDLDAVFAYEAELRDYGVRALSQIEGLKLLSVDGDAHVPVLSFTLHKIHPHDVGTALDFAGIAVRTGHHCAQPLMAHLGVTGTIRASLAFYNTRAELDALCAALRELSPMFYPEAR